MPSSLLLLFPSRLLCGRQRKGSSCPGCFSRLIWSASSVKPLPAAHTSSSLSLQVFTYSQGKAVTSPLPGAVLEDAVPSGAPTSLPILHHSMCCSFSVIWLREVEGRFEAEGEGGAGVYKHSAMIFVFFNIAGRIQCTKENKRRALNMKSENDTCCSLSGGTWQERLISHVHWQSFQAVVFLLLKPLYWCVFSRS